MNIKVMYHSSTGNTRKVADAIAAQLNVKAEPLRKEPVSIPEPIDLLFIGDGLYGGKTSKQMLVFIDQLNPVMVKNAAVFATYGGQTVIGEIIARLLREKGINVIGEPFVCKGKCWFFINRGRPNGADLNTARRYAKAMLTKINRK